MHNFDDGVIEDDLPEEEEVYTPPPPPLFTESQLETAKRQAFDEGHAQGVKEVESSRAQSLANMMKLLAQDTQTLFASETARELRYEQEVVALCRNLFKHAFPRMHKAYAFEELIGQLQTILASQQGKRQIEMRVSADYVQGVEAFLNKLSTQNPDLQFHVQADETLGESAFKMRWKDGGAIYDPQKTAQAILENLDEMLAGTHANSHDSMDNESHASGEAPSEQTFDNADDNPTDGGTI